MKKNLKLSLTTGLLVLGFASTQATALADTTNNNVINYNPSQFSQSNQQVKIKLQPQKTNAQFSSMNRIAQANLDTPYVWGGTTTSGFDCSGFVKYVYQKSLGYTLPRTAQAQYNAGQAVSENNAKAGDLVFFGTSLNNITHVGMYLGNGKMIDAQNRGVVVENIHASYWHLVGFSHYDAAN